MGAEELLVCWLFTLRIVWLTVLNDSAQLHKRGLSYLSPAQEKDPNLRIEVLFLPNAYCFHTIVKLKIC